MSAVLPEGPQQPTAGTAAPELLDLLVALLLRWKRLLLLPLGAGVLALGATYLVPKTYTASTLLLPPQQQQSAAASALAQLSALSGLAAAGGARTPGDQYVALLRSRSVADRLIDTFELMKVYEVELRFEAREALGRRVRVSLGRKDGLIAIEVDDHDPQRAAAMANAHVEELRRLTSSLALTEAQQRRVFLEKHLEQTRQRLTAAQRELQGGGFNPGALKADARVAAETYARLRAEATAAEIRLQALRERLADTTPEIQQLLAQLRGLRSRVAQAEIGAPSPDDGDYIGRFREFKYQETLFDLFARQYELARLDESREGALIQVVDVAVAPEHKSRPKRGLIAVATTLGTGLLLAIWILLRALSEHGSGPGLRQRLAAARRAAGG
jgi:uncharacterized protein involved in exopolysaccharide biosynthesis